MPEDTKKLIEDIYSIAEERKIETLETAGDDDFSFSISNLGRFRISTYRQRGSLAAVIRLIAFQLPNPEELEHFIPRSCSWQNTEKDLYL